LITSKEAIAAAKAHGLKLADAAALLKLADSVEEADLFAAEFGKAPQTQADNSERINAHIRKAAGR
jgi:hypothetical protein